MHRQIAWQSGQFAFEGETLAQAVTEFARYSDIRIVIEDPALAREEIAGLFKATDPVGFALNNRHQSECACPYSRRRSTPDPLTVGNAAHRAFQRRKADRMFQGGLWLGSVRTGLPVAL